MLKKLSMILLAVFFVGCYNLDSLINRNDRGSIREIEIEGSQKDRYNTKKADTKNQVEKIVPIEVTNQSVSEYLNIIKSNLRSSVKKIDDDVKNKYTVAIGETLIFPVEDEKAVKLITSPKNTNSKISLTHGQVNFRTVYQGQYVLSTYIDGSVNRKIAISAVSKYNFSEKDLYNLILINSEKRNKSLENSVTLYKMLYPAGRYTKEVNYLFLKYAYDIRDNSLMNEALTGIKNDFSSYSDSEKADILKVANLMNKQIFVPSQTYNSNNSDLKNALDEYNAKNIEKNKLYTKDVDTKETDTSATEYMKEKIRSVINGSSNSNVATNVSSTKVKSSSNESYYEKALKNLNSNPRIAIDNFKKSLSSEKIQDKKPEIYYNIASSYAKLGNRAEVTKYIRLLKQEFPNNSWTKKSEALSNLIK